MDDENIIDKAIDANIEARMEDDNALRSITSKVIQAEDQGLPGTQKWLEESAALRGGELGSTTDSKFLQSYVPGIISSMTTDTAGILNRLIDIPGLNRGDSSLYGPKDYYDTTFGTAHEGEMVIPLDQVFANPNFDKYIQNMSSMMAGNATKQLDKFREDKGLVTKEDWNSYLQDLHAKDMLMNAGVEIDENERDEILQIGKLLNQVIDPRPYRMTEDGNSIVIRSDLLPSVPMEPDPKFTEEGYLSLPYGGTYSMRDGELFLEAPSMFRATDELSDAERGIFQSDAGTDYLKKMEDYLYPNLSPEWRYGDTGASTFGYQAGQLTPAISGVAKLATMGAKGLASLYRGAKNKLLQRQPIQAVDYLKTEPYFE